MPLEYGCGLPRSYLIPQAAISSSTRKTSVLSTAREETISLYEEQDHSIKDICVMIEDFGLAGDSDDAKDSDMGEESSFDGDFDAVGKLSVSISRF